MDWQKDLLRTTAKSGRPGQGNKLRFYSKIKDNFEMEPYLDILLKVNRINITRLRVSCHSLAVELGRHNHPPIPLSNRLCSVCNSIEDETHYLLYCTKYSEERNELFSNLSTILKTSFKDLPELTQIQLLLSSSNVKILYITSTYLNKTLPS